MLTRNVVSGRALIFYFHEISAVSMQLASSNRTELSHLHSLGSVEIAPAGGLIGIHLHERVATVDKIGHRTKMGIRTEG